MRPNLVDGVLLLFVILSFTALFVTLENLPWYQQHLKPNWNVVEVDFYVGNQSGLFVDAIIPGIEEVRNGDLRGRILKVERVPELSNVSADKYTVLITSRLLAKDFDHILTYEKKTLHLGASIVFTSDRLRLDGVVKNFTVLENETRI